MSERYSIIYTEPAVQDLLGIYRYISQVGQDDRSALRISTRIKDSIERLDVFPERFRICFPANDLRRMNVGKYAVLYRTDEDERKASIYRIVYSGMDMKELLNDLKIDQ